MFYGYDLEAGSMHACIVDVDIAYDESETGQVVIFLTNLVIEMKGLNHHLLCPMRCHTNGILTNEVLAPIQSQTTHAIEIENAFKIPIYC